MKANNKKETPEMDKNLTEARIKSFLFYISYYEAIQTLGYRNRLLAYEAIIKYALYKEEPTNLPSRVLAIFKMAVPTIDSAHKNYQRTIKKNQKSASDYFEQKPIEKVSLPKKENNTVPADEFTD
jgi:hypothetical protein